MSFKPLKDSLNEAISKLPASSQIKAAFVVAEANKALKEVFEVSLEHRARAVSYRDGVLVIECQNGAVAQEISHKKKQLLETLKEKGVKEIRTKIG